MDGNLTAIAWIVERLEGKATQSIELNAKADLLKGMSDAEVRQLIDAIKRKAIASDDNNGNVGT